MIVAALRASTVSEIERSDEPRTPTFPAGGCPGSCGSLAVPRLMLPCGRCWATAKSTHHRQGTAREGLPKHRCPRVDAIILDELVAAKEGTLHFGGMGLPTGNRLTPVSALDRQQAAVAVDLTDDVGGQTTGAVDRLRRVH